MVELQNSAQYFLLMCSLMTKGIITLIIFDRKMKDQELYELVKKAVKDRKKIPHHSSTKTFAERYCEQQLQKKYNPQNSSHKKGGMRMDNFAKVETYINLPELIKELRELKIEQQQKKDMKENNEKKIEENVDQIDQQPKRSRSKHFAQLKNIRHATQNWNIKHFLSSLQHQNQWSFEGTRNNSVYNMNSIDRSIQDIGDTNSTLENIKLFNMLKSFLKSEKQYNIKQKKPEFQRNKIDSQKKKQANKYLHKISSYLQIVLENQHKHKWNINKNENDLKLKTAHRIQLNNDKFTKKKIRINKRKPVTIIKDLSDANHLQAIKEQTRMLKGEEEQSTPKYLIKTHMTESVDNFKIKKMNTSDMKKSKDSFTTSPSPHPLKQTMKTSNSIKQTFTFRRRSVKEKIIKKIDQFISDIDEETHCNKKQNNYFNNQINKLEHNLKRLYGRYRKQTIAGDQDIQNLKKLAQAHSVMTPSRNVSKNNIDEQLNKSVHQQNANDCA